MAKVRLVDLEGKGTDAAVGEMFGSFGGGRSMLKSSRDVYIKVNVIDSKPNVYTDPALVGAVIRYFRSEGARNIYVIENCTQGNFTRLVFHKTGMARVCRKNGASAVYLDETPASPAWLPNMQCFLDLSSVVHEKLIKGKNENLYINIPILKTHSMSGVTIGVKNQFGLVHQHSRIADHNFKLHRKLADLYHVVSPDFTLVDARNAMNHGHYTPEKFEPDCIIPMGLLIGGRDTLAVDTVGAHLMGFDIADVEHLRLLREDGAGCGDLAAIDIEGRELVEQRRRNLTHELKDEFPAGVTIIRGRERCCAEGCRRNTETAMEVFANDVGCSHDFAIVMGKDADPAEVAKVNGPVLLVGGCAIEDYETAMKDRLGAGRVFVSPGCNNLAATCSALMALMGISPMKVTGLNPLVSLQLFISAKIHGSKALVTRIIPERVAR